MIFLDTSYLVAAIMEEDQLHEIALEWSRTTSGPFVTTGFVLWELVNRLSSVGHRARLHAALPQIVSDPMIEIVEATASWMHRGITLHRDRPDKRWSLTDCISFLVMRERGVVDALTHDEHFLQAGFRALLRESASAS